MTQVLQRPLSGALVFRYRRPLGDLRFRVVDEQCSDLVPEITAQHKQTGYKKQIAPTALAIKRFAS